MNRILLIIFTIALIGTFMSSCNDDDDDFSNVEVKNTKLKTILQNRGYTFNNEGNLVQDAQVQDTKSIDLSGCDLDDVAGLDIFPNLTEVNLSDNNFSASFNFSVLPSSVTSVDLTGNQIYEYPGLVNVETAKNGDETVTKLREMKKLYLPSSAKYNCDDLVYFYEQNQNDIEDGTIDIKMEDANGSLAQYTTLREVPEDTVRNYLKEQFPSLFSGDKIDISKRLINISEVNKNISHDKFTNAEGFAYIAMNRGFDGGYIALYSSAETSIPYLKIKRSLYTILLKNINTTDLDLSEAPNLLYCEIGNNNTIKSLDLSICKRLGQRGLEKEMSGDEPSQIIIFGCPLLEILTLPEKTENIIQFTACNLPKLEKLDLSHLKCVYQLGLGGLSSCQITFPSPTHWFDEAKMTGVNEENGATRLGIDEEILQVEGMEDFIKTYRSHLKYSSLSIYGGQKYHWNRYY
jgi:Leucine-rich repeat (LRR) protein